LEPGVDGDFAADGEFGCEKEKFGLHLFAGWNFKAVERSMGKKKHFPEGGCNPRASRGNFLVTPKPAPFCESDLSQFWGKCGRVAD
jgi:hypothetical protein